MVAREKNREGFIADECNAAGYGEENVGAPTFQTMR